MLPRARRYLEDEQARQADEDLVTKILDMGLRPGEEDELRAAVRAFEGSAASLQDCTHAHATVGSGAAPPATAARACAHCITRVRTGQHAPVVRTAAPHVSRTCVLPVRKKHL